jgi:type IV pilus assembly protein PilA
MLSKESSQMRNRLPTDHGFTLVELLVTIVVVGLLAAIAIPRFMDQRVRAWESAAQNALHGAVLAQHSHLTDNAVFSSAEADLVGSGFPNDATVDFWIDPSTTMSRFQVHAQHCSGGDQFRYVSDGAGRIERIARAARVC